MSVFILNMNKYKLINKKTTQKGCLISPPEKNVAASTQNSPREIK